MCFISNVTWKYNCSLGSKYGKPYTNSNWFLEIFLNILFPVCQSYLHRCPGSILGGNLYKYAIYCGLHSARVMNMYDHSQEVSFTKLKKNAWIHFWISVFNPLNSKDTIYELMSSWFYAGRNWTWSMYRKYTISP